MTSYIKHLNEIMRRAGAEPTLENKQLLDNIIREITGLEKADSADVWKQVKNIMFSGDDAKKKRFEELVVKRMVKRMVTG